MGLSHKKRLRRHVEFYLTAFGFHEPLKILVDGNFLHQIQRLKQGDLIEVIQSALGCRVKLFCTPCIVNELRSLGSPFVVATETAEALHLHKCSHRPFVSAADCLIHCAGSVNHDHWWIATQDPKLREVLNGIPGVPCLFLTYNGLFIETPSEASKKSAETTESNALGIAKWELQTEALKHLPEMSRSQNRSIFRKKRAKGPNPLSCLKKRARDTGTSPPSDTAPIETKLKRRRRRDTSKQQISMAASAKEKVL